MTTKRRGPKPGSGTQPPTIAVSFRLLPEDKDRLDQLCEERDMPQAAVIGAALRLYAGRKATK